MLKIIITLSVAILIAPFSSNHNSNNNRTSMSYKSPLDMYSNNEDGLKQYAPAEPKNIVLSNIKNTYNGAITFSVYNDDFEYFNTTDDVNSRVSIDQDFNENQFEISILPLSSKGNVAIETKRLSSNNFQKIDIFFEEYKELYFVSEVSENDLKQKIASFKLAQEEISSREYERQMSDLFSLGSIENEYTVLNLQNNDNTFHGNIYWIDDSDNTHSANYIKVELWDEDTGLFNPDDLLATTYTNSSGFFNFTYNNVDTNGGANGQDIYLKIFTESSNVKVHSSSSTTSYTHITDTIVDIPNGDNRNLNLSINMDNTFGQAMQIVQAATYSAQYVEHLERNKYNQPNPTFVMPLVKVRYPYGDGAYYEGGTTSRITIPGPRETDQLTLHGYSTWDVIAHEYGHHVQNIFGIEDSPGGGHYINANMADIYVDGDEVLNISPTQQYDIAKSKGVRLAWGEGWATYFAVSVTKYFINEQQEINNIFYAGDTRYQSYNGVNINLDSFTFLGEACELTISNFLYKLTYQSIGDSIVLPELLLWQSIVLVQPITLSELVLELYSYEGFYYSHSDFGLLLEKFDISPSNINVSFGYNQSSSPTIQWNKGGDMGSEYFSNDTFDLYITSKWADHFLVGKVGLTSSSYTLTSEEWNIIKNQGYGEFNVIVTGYASNFFATGGYHSSQYQSKKVSFSVLPSEYGFAQQYFYYTTDVNHNLMTNKFSTSRLRTGYIENEYVVLSARKNDAGIAFLEYSTGFPISNISIEMAFWSQNEYLTSADSTATIQYKNNDGTWINIVNLLENDILPTDRNSPTKINISFSTNIYEFRIYVQTAQIGTINKGRICVGELQFNPSN